MTKQLFLNELAAALHSLPREERYRTLGYYDELIDDRMEDRPKRGGRRGQPGRAPAGGPGDSGEEEPAPSTSRGRKVWLIVLLVLGFPLWGSLLLVAAIVLLCVYICLFLPAFVLGVLALGCLASALVGVVGTPVLMLDVGLFTGGLPAGLFQLGLSVALLGLAVLSALGFYFTGRATVKAGRAIWRGIRRCFSKKGRLWYETETAVFKLSAIVGCSCWARECCSAAPGLWAWAAIGTLSPTPGAASLWRSPPLWRRTRWTPSRFTPRWAM